MLPASVCVASRYRNMDDQTDALQDALQQVTSADGQGILLQPFDLLELVLAHVAATAGEQAELTLNIRSSSHLGMCQMCIPGTLDCAVRVVVCGFKESDSGRTSRHSLGWTVARESSGTSGPLPHPRFRSPTCCSLLQLCRVQLAVMVEPTAPCARGRQGRCDPGMCATHVCHSTSDASMADVARCASESHADTAVAARSAHVCSHPPTSRKTSRSAHSCVCSPPCRPLPPAAQPSHPQQRPGRLSPVAAKAPAGRFPAHPQTGSARFLDGGGHCCRRGSACIPAG